MTWEMLYAKNYFVVVVVIISFLWYYLHELSPGNFAIYVTMTNLTAGGKIIDWILSTKAFFVKSYAKTGS